MGDNEYKTLLYKYASNKEIYKLIELCKLNEFKSTEIFYQKNKRYPETRDCLGKLLIDLQSAYIDLNNKNRG